MNVKIINPFLDATANVIQSMFSISVAASTPYAVSKIVGSHRWEISGILGLTGEYDGIIAFRLHKILARKMLERSGVAFKTDDQRAELESGMIAEITNIISGNAISHIKDYALDIAPPVVIYGENHTISWPQGYPIVGIPFSSSAGPFEIDVCFKEHDYA